MSLMKMEENSFRRMENPQLIWPLILMQCIFNVDNWEFSKGELNYFTDLIGEVATNISAGNFPMTAPTSWMCTEKWCQHYFTCRGGHFGWRK